MSRQMGMRRFSPFLSFIVLCLSFSASADDWGAPEPVSFHSRGFGYVAEIFPPQSRQNPTAANPARISGLPRVTARPIAGVDKSGVPRSKAGAVGHLIAFRTTVIGSQGTGYPNSPPAHPAVFSSSNQMKRPGMHRAFSSLFLLLAF